MNRPLNKGNIIGYIVKKYDNGELFYYSEACTIVFQVWEVGALNTYTLCWQAHPVTVSPHLQTRLQTVSYMTCVNRYNGQN